MLHWSISLSDSASFSGGYMIGRSVRRVVEVEESVAHGVLESVADRTAAVVPYGAFIERDRIRWGGGRWCAWWTPVAKERAEEEEERKRKGSEKCGQDWAEEIEYFHFRCRFAARWPVDLGFARFVLWFCGSRMRGRQALPRTAVQSRFDFGLRLTVLILNKLKSEFNRW